MSPMCLEILFSISALLPQIAVDGSRGSERPRDRQLKEAPPARPLQGDQWAK